MFEIVMSWIELYMKKFQDSIQVVNEVMNQKYQEVYERYRCDWIVQFLIKNGWLVDVLRLGGLAVCVGEWGDWRYLIFVLMCAGDLRGMGGVGDIEVKENIGNEYRRRLFLVESLLMVRSMLMLKENGYFGYLGYMGRVVDVIWWVKIILIHSVNGEEEKLLWMDLWGVSSALQELGRLSRKTSTSSTHTKTVQEEEGKEENNNVMTPTSTTTTPTVIWKAHLNHVLKWVKVMNTRYWMKNMMDIVGWWKKVSSVPAVDVADINPRKISKVEFGGRILFSVMFLVINSNLVWFWVGCCMIRGLWGVVWTTHVANVVVEYVRSLPVVSKEGGTKVGEIQGVGEMVLLLGGSHPSLRVDTEVMMETGVKKRRRMAPPGFEDSLLFMPPELRVPPGSGGGIGGEGKGSQAVIGMTTGEREMLEGILRGDNKEMMKMMESMMTGVIKRK